LGPPWSEKKKNQWHWDQNYLEGPRDNQQKKGRKRWSAFQREETKKSRVAGSEKKKLKTRQRKAKSASTKGA